MSEQHAELQYTSFLKMKPSIGDYKTMARENNTTELRNRLLLECVDKLDALVLKNQLSVHNDLELFNEHLIEVAVEAERKANEAQRQAQCARQAIDVKAAEVRGQREQEILNLQVVMCNMSPDAGILSADSIALIMEKADGLTSCRRDRYGIILDSDAVVGVEARAQSAIDGIARLDRPGGRQRELGTLTKGGNTRLTHGSMLHATGTPEGTSDANHGILLERSERLKRDGAQADADALLAANAKRARLSTLGARIAAAAVCMDNVTPTISYCRAYLKLLKEEAGADKRKEERKRLIEIGKLTGVDLRARVVELFKQRRADVASAAAVSIALVSAGSDVGDTADVLSTT